MKKRSGFSVVEALLIFVIIGIVGGVGWFVYSAGRNSDSSSPAAVTTSQKPDNTQERANWMTYKNSRLGISFQVPKENENSYAGCKKEPDSYRPVSGIVPTKIFEDGNTIHISVEYYYLLGGETKTPNGLANFSSCEKVVNTLQAIKNDGREDFAVEDLPLHVGIVKDNADLDKFVKYAYGNKFSFVKTSPSSDGAWHDVEIDCSDCELWGLGKTELRYYPDKNRVVSWVLGQYNHFPNSGNPDKSFDLEIVNSLKFL